MLNTSEIKQLFRILKSYYGDKWRHRDSEIGIWMRPLNKHDFQIGELADAVDMWTTNGNEYPPTVPELMMLMRSVRKNKRLEENSKALTDQSECDNWMRIVAKIVLRMNPKSVGHSFEQNHTFHKKLHERIYFEFVHLRGEYPNPKDCPVDELNEWMQRIADEQCNTVPCHDCEGQDIETLIADDQRQTQSANQN